MESLADRLNRAMKLRDIKYKKELAEMAGVSPGAVTQWFTGDTANLAADTLIKLAKGLRVRVEWLKEGLGPMEPDDEPEDDFKDFVMIRRLDVKASAGNGNLVFLESDKGKMAFRRDFLRSEGAKDSEALVCYADGQSMEPTIPDGAVLLINLGRTEFVNNGIFVIRLEGEVLVKRLRREIGGGIQIVSDNQDKNRYPDIHITPDKEDLLTIVGRVFWMGARL
ncbi:helix-turn-helix transcriptional regulator [Cupriavidus sp. D384]|uniref:XRE family transcriptional regulator n=1 Tax=Cupriavidus sp. D384 TaxID=1538095 RepID=UPI0008347A68|nr:helix-turn-helix transcriptional regulator [Cupriavidus sp. D384]